jgi:hypothetical protein
MIILSDPIMIGLGPACCSRSTILMLNLVRWVFGRLSHAVVVPEYIWLCHGTDIKPIGELVSHDATDKYIKVCENEGSSLGVVLVVSVVQNGSRGGISVID